MTKETRDPERRRRNWSRRIVGVITPLLILGFAQPVWFTTTTTTTTTCRLIYNLGLLPRVEALAAAKNKRRGRNKASSGGGGSKVKGGGFGGFGSPPPTLEDFLVTTVKKTRLPENASTLPCPCGATTTTTTTGGDDDDDVAAVVVAEQPKTYAECCAPLHENDSALGGCTTPLQVLQSRYVAFAYRNIGHVIRTTHEECRDYRNDKLAWAKDLDKEGMFDSLDFVGLEVVDDAQNSSTGSSTEQQRQIEFDRDDDDDNDNEAFLDFKVRLRGRSLEDAPVRSRSLSSIEGEETVVSERSRFLRDPDSGHWRYAGGDVRSTVEGLEDASLNA